MSAFDLINDNGAFQMLTNSQTGEVSPAPTVEAFLSGATGLAGTPSSGDPFVAITSQGTDVVTNAPFQLVFGGASFNGRFDPMLFFGYNVADGAARPLAGEPQFQISIEGDYDDGATRTVESYLQYISNDGGTTIRPWFARINRSTDESLLSFSSDILSFNAADGTQIFKVEAPSSVKMVAVTGTNTYFRLDAPASRGAHLLLGYGGTQDLFDIGTISATIASFSLAGRDIVYLLATSGGPAASVMAVGGVLDNSAVGLFAVNTSPVGVKGLVARGASGQTGNLFEVQDSTSAVLSTFSENGYFTTRKTAAPADGELVAGELALWFDSTNGAAKLMVKAKEAGGTVRTATVALA